MSQSRPGLASNVNLNSGHWTMDGSEEATDMESSDTGRSISGWIWTYLACFHLHQYGPHIGGGFRDDHKRRTGTQGWEYLTVNWQQQTSWKSLKNIKLEKLVDLDLSSYFGSAWKDNNEEYPHACPPQDWPHGGQSWGGQFWVHGSSGLPTSITMFLWHITGHG